ncbi:MAG: protein kinase [Gemmatimonadales bacterium]|nr:protein kinase [Gemmatimonadales bacterium]
MTVLVSAGTVLGGRYALEREVGRGGMARVYVAQDIRQHRRVAVKILRPDVAVSLGPERFLREIDIASRLTHPHILPVHDSGDADGVLFYVMPYVEGESLRERLVRERRLPVDEALAITREVADALAYAHRLDVVHRDIKPGNVLLQAGHAGVADFGVARAISAAADERVTSTGLIVGTPVYMSPEQASGETIDGRADIYALGCVAYEMLTGAPPFMGKTPQEVIAQHQTAPLRPIRALRPDVPVPVAAAIEKALAKLPEDRHANALALIEALRAPGQWEPSPGARNRTAAVVLALVLAVAAAFLARTLLRARPAARTPLEIVVLPLDGDTLLRSAGAPRAHDLFADLIDWIPGLRAAEAGDLVPAGQSWRDVPLADLLARARRAGGRYLLAGGVLPADSGARVTVDLYATESGERLSHAVDSTGGGTLDGPVGRLAAGMVGTVARREDLELGSAGAVLAATSILPAVGHMLQAQQKFWTGDLDAAAAELRSAVDADSTCGLAYQRLSVVHASRHDYPAALSAVNAGLERADSLVPRWIHLLQAQRYLVLGYGDSAIAAYQGVVLDDRNDIDGWYGLGEALMHHAAFSGASPRDARPAFERVAAIDSAFAPVYDHLVDLAVYDGDEPAARTFLARVRTDRPLHPAKEAEVRLRFGPAAARAPALAALRAADRQAISEAVISWAHGGFDLRLADTAASFLLGRDRVPDDRRRGAQYRLVTLAGLGRWPAGLAAWDTVTGAAPFDPWLIQADLAGYPVGDRARPMYEWARAQARAGLTPDFTLPPWDELRQGFEALVYRAVLAGDSSETLDLLGRIDRAPPADPVEPAPDALRQSLRARLALLSADTAGAIDALRRAIARVPEVYTANHPLTAVGPQRLLLSRLLLARGDTTESERWRRSFVRSWSVADRLFVARLDALGTGIPLSPFGDVP